MDRNFLILIARVFLSAVYLYSGVDKLVFWNDGLKFCVEHKMPRPNVVLAVTAIIHLVCGLMVLLGFFAREGAVVLLLFTIIATRSAGPARTSGVRRRSRSNTSPSSAGYC